MSKRIILSTDSTCDLGVELKEKYNIEFVPYHITLEDKEYLDNIDIKPGDIFKAYKERGVLPKTAAINIADYTDHFEKLLKEGDAIIHICLGGALSTSYNSCRLAAAEFENVYAIDSCNLSTGVGHLVLEAAKLIEKGMEAEEIAKELDVIKKRIHSSFIINKLDFLHAGGRCSALTALGANLLKLKPCIEVNNNDGSMAVGKKYRGDLKATLVKYVEDKLSSYDNIDTEKIFITYTDVDESYIEAVREAVDKIVKFDNVYYTQASCTISCHCGPDTLGILFMTK